MTSQPPFLRRLVAALLSALAVAATTHAATVLVFFATNGNSGAKLQPISDFFIATDLVLFVLLTIGALIGAYRRWWFTLGFAFVVAVASAFLGTTITFVRGGNLLTSGSLPSIAATLGDDNLIVIVAAMLATVTLGVRVWRAVLAREARIPASSRNLALVRLPSSSLAAGELTHKKRVPVDIELADRQWEGYVAVLEAEGFSIMEVEAADALPDAVFIEDAVVILDRTAVVTSPGAESRRAELAGVEEAVALLGLDVHHITLPGTLDGGDVLTVGRTVYVGRSARSNAEGVRQFRAIANGLGYTVVAVPVAAALHLKSAVTALPDGTIIGFPKLIEHPELFERFLAVPEAEGASIVVLGPDALLLSAAAPKTAELLTDLGYRVVTVDIGEFEKLEGGVTCLSVRIR